MVSNRRAISWRNTSSMFVELEESRSPAMYIAKMMAAADNRAVDPLHAVSA
ncbi:nitrate reductase beta subunit [Bradyrhizobium sp. F1.13.1]